LFCQILQAKNGLHNHSLFSNAPTPMAINYSTLTVIVLVLSLLSLFLLSREWNRRDKQISDLRKRVLDLEKANIQRLPYKSFEEILNGMAALEVLERETDFKKDVIQNAKAHFTSAMAAGTRREKK
jgi:hypothetical protein